MDSYMEQGWKEDKHSSCTLTVYYFSIIYYFSLDLCHQLQTVAAYCGHYMTNHHNALADAEACAIIALQLL